MRDKVFSGRIASENSPRPPSSVGKRMKLDQALVGTTRAELCEAMAAMRSAKAVAGRRRRRDHIQEAAAESDRRAAHRRRERELAKLLRWRVRVQVPPERRPKVGRLMRRLENRSSGFLPGKIGSTSSRGPDGYHSIYFEFTARGFQTQSGRPWKPGEAKRAGLYVIRDAALGDPERDWWSNIGEDAAEVAAFMDLLEDVERGERKNANVYISEIIALPAELWADEQREVLIEICRFFESRGLPYVVAKHDPDAAGDQRNYHAHLIYSCRRCERTGPFDWNISLDKDPAINTPTGIGLRRRDVVRCINEGLEAAGQSKRYIAASRASRGMPRGEEKRGKAQTAVLRRRAALEAEVADLQTARNGVAAARDALAACGSRIEALRQKAAGRLASGREISFPSGDALRAKVQARMRSAASTGLTDGAVKLHHLQLRVDAAAAALEKRRRVAALRESKRKMLAEMEASGARLAGLGVLVIAKLAGHRAEVTKAVATVSQRLDQTRGRIQAGLDASMRTDDTIAQEQAHRRRRAKVDARIALSPALADLEHSERSLLLGRLQLPGLKGRVSYGLRRMAKEVEESRQSSEERLQAGRRHITAAWESARDDIIRKMMAASRRPVFRREGVLSFSADFLSESEAEYVRRGGDRIFQLKVAEVDAAWTRLEKDREAHSSHPVADNPPSATADSGLTWEQLSWALKNGRDGKEG